MSDDWHDARVTSVLHDADIEEDYQCYPSKEYPLYLHVDVASKVLTEKEMVRRLRRTKDEPVRSLEGYRGERGFYHVSFEIQFKPNGEFFIR